MIASASLNGYGPWGFRGVIASASLKQGDVADLDPVLVREIPRRDCLGHIEAHARVAMSFSWTVDSEA